MADDTTKRTTSFAKTLKGLQQQQNALDQFPELREIFNRVVESSRHPAERQDEQEKARQADDRRVAHAPRPEMHLKPDGPIRRAMDKKIDYEKIRKVAASVRQRREAARSRGLTRDFDRER